MHEHLTLRDPEELGKVYDHTLVRRLLGYVKPYTRHVALAAFLMLVANGVTLAGPYLIKEAIDSGIVGGNVGVLDLMVALYVAVNLTFLGTQYGQMYLMYWVGQRVIFQLRLDLFGHIQRLSFSFYDQTGVGRIMSRVQNDVNVLNDLVSFGLIGVISDILSIAGIVAVMLYMNTKLSLLTFSVLPVMVLALSLWRRRARSAYRETREAIAHVNGMLQEVVSGMRVLQSLGREKQSYQEFSGANRRNLNANIKATWFSALLLPSVDVVGAVAVGLVIWIGGSRLVDVGLTPGQLVAFLLYIGRFFDPIRDLSQRYDTFQSAMAAGERVFDLADTKPDIVQRDGALHLPRLEGRVTFDRVTFGYDSTPVLKDLSLDIRPGETIAFVGETGAGKTSLVNLIGRFYDIQGGHVRVDGFDVREVELNSLRQQLGIVMQEPFLFSGTIADNIRYGRLSATDEQVVAAAKAVNAHDFILRLADGYETEVQERGSKLSGGQRQLIAFARAVLADPRILILDEATASVDTETEQAIQEALRSLLRGRTSLVIAHRLSTTKEADRIVVIHDGRIVETGTHEELLRKRGRYYQLYRLQFEPASPDAVA